MNTTRKNSSKFNNTNSVKEKIINIHQPIENRYYLWIYITLFFSVWCIRELWVINYLNHLGPGIRTVISAFIKISVWVLPVILLVKFVDKKNPITFLLLRTNINKGLKWAFWVSIALGTYFMVLKVLLFNNNIKLNFEINVWLNTIILVGFIEEIVFRGYLLRKLMEIFSFWKSNVLTSILFVAIHFPIWLSIGIFEYPNIIGNVIVIFTISIIFGIIYKRSNSLWSVIIIHSVYNFFVTAFN